MLDDIDWPAVIAVTGCAINVPLSSEEITSLTSECAALPIIPAIAHLEKAFIAKRAARQQPVEWR